MKIFATSDIHGNRAIADKLEQAASRAEMVIICGDIGGKEHFVRGRSLCDAAALQRKDAVSLIDRMKGFPVPVRFILGNDDWFEYSGDCYLSKPESISGYDFIPFEFVSITPFNTNREVNENKMRYELDKLKVNKKTVIVAHTPPYRYGDVLENGIHVGSRTVASWLRETNPKIWLCGHIHESYVACIEGGTQVFNCACDHERDLLRGWIIDLDSNEYESVIM